MKPRRLKVEGLNSFIQEQEIDFTILTDKGFFGIFGPTGSGKSTILDAITIALYGDIARSVKKNEFINSFRKDMNVYYEFEIGVLKQRKHYSVERHYKRKKDGGVICDRAVLADLSDEQIKVLAEGSAAVTEQIVGIIGLKVDDFTRSVVLPQGKFSEFLKLTKSDRGKMLERILSLEEFGSKMVAKLKLESGIKEAELERLNGAISGFKDVSEDAIEAKKHELILLQQQEKELRIMKDRIEQDYKKFSQIWELQGEAQGYENRWQELEKVKNNIDAKSLQVEAAKRAAMVKPILDMYQETEQKRIKSNRQIEELMLEYSSSELIQKATEEKYINAAKLKEDKLQQLVVKETELVEALKLDKEIKELENGLVSLREEYELHKKRVETIEAQIKENQAVKANCANKIERNEEELSKLKVSPEYREKVGRALLKEQEYTDASNKLKNINMLVNEVGAHLVKANIELTAIANDKDHKEKTLFEADENKAELEKSNPGDVSVVHELSLKLQQMTAKLEELVKNNEVNAKLRQELDELSKMIAATKEKYQQKKQEEDKTRNQLEQSRRQIEELKIQNMAGTIASHITDGQPCPVCGSAHHPHIAVYNQESLEKLKAYEKLNEQLQNQLLLDQEEANSYQIQLTGFETSFSHKAEQIKDLHIDVDGMSIEALKEQITRGTETYKQQKQKIEKFTALNKELDETLIKLKEEVHSAIIKYERAHAEYEKDKKHNEELKKEQEEERKRFYVVEESFKSMLKELGIESISDENTRLNENATIEEKLRHEQLELRQEIAELDRRREMLEAEKIVELGRVETVKTSGVERRKKKDDFIEKMASYTDGKDAQQYYQDVIKQKTEIIENEARLKNEYESVKNKMAAIYDERLKAENNQKMLNSLLIENKEKLEQALIDNKMTSIEDVIKSMLSKDLVDVYETEIKTHIDQVKTISDNLQRIRKKLGGESIDKESWEKLLKDREANEKGREVLAGSIAECSSGIQRMLSDLKAVKQYSDIKKQVQHKLDILKDISSLVSGNKFVEFAATNQLRYIAGDASRRLREITRGRYALELDSSNEFVMRDDFSGGLRRSADTLSGGETFLTSLCLALSLSSHIQLKGKSPLEFFFLDEGFGTLDVELLEVVIASLERLRNDRLCVGIISHVEELKNRVPVKLIVTPATIDGDGSRVSVEYS